MYFKEKRDCIQKRKAGGEIRLKRRRRRRREEGEEDSELNEGERRTLFSRQGSRCERDGDIVWIRLNLDAGRG